MQLFILLQGLNPKLSRYEAALALYEREAGLKPEKVCHFVFFEHMLLMELDKKKHEEATKNTHINLYLGALLSALNLMFLSASFLETKAPNLQNYFLKKNMPSPFEIYKHVCASPHGHLGPWVLHAIFIKSGQWLHLI